MNIEEEAKRLAGCAGMESETLERDILMALENAGYAADKKANDVILKVTALVSSLVGRRLPQEQEIIAINGICNDYLKERFNA